MKEGATGRSPLRAQRRKGAKFGGKLLDPICDMTVEPASAAGKFDYDGATFYFCSVHCQKLFQSDPAKYLAAANARQESQQAQPQRRRNTMTTQSPRPSSQGQFTLTRWIPKRAA
jgi:YHS domain-containing protein